MADWNQLRAYIHNKYSATDISPRAIEMKFTIGEGAAPQITYVSFGEAPNGDHWGQIDSPIGPIERIDIVRALSLVENVVCGGLCHLTVQGVQLLSIRHCLPLANFDPEEFEAPLHFVTLAANAFKNELTTGISSSPFNTR